MEPDVTPPSRRGESEDFSPRPAGGTPALQWRDRQDAPFNSSGQKMPLFQDARREILGRMKTTLPQNLVREVAPSGHWKQENEDEKQSLEASVREWLEDAAMNERLFQTHVYDNPDLGDLDLRQHRARLHTLLANAEILAMKLNDLRAKTTKPREAQSLLESVEQKRKQLFDALFGWHAPLESQPDVPASFKEAAREASAGRVVDLDI